MKEAAKCAAGRIAGTVRRHKKGCRINDIPDSSDLINCQIPRLRSHLQMHHHNPLLLHHSRRGM